MTVRNVAVGLYGRELASTPRSLPVALASCARHRPDCPIILKLVQGLVFSQYAEFLDAYYLPTDFGRSKSTSGIIGIWVDGVPQDFAA